jgi:hypothetical protein
MSTLRERLIAMADSFYDCQPNRHEIALAAARMALTDALMDCAPPAAFDQEDCENAIRALRDGLE